MRLASTVAVALVLLVQLAACGSSSDETGATAAAAEEITAVAHPGDWSTLKKQAGRYADKLVIPEGPSPEEVVVQDLKPGTGAPIQPGDTFAVRYVDYDYANGEVMERNWETPAWRLKWKIGELVDGWEPGLAGIRADGTRELIVPSRLAYGNGPRVYFIEIDYIERH